VRWAENGAGVVEAGIARRRGDVGVALRLLERSAARAKEYGTALMGAALDRRRGELAGGDEGRALVAAAEAFMTGRGIADPARMMAMLVGDAGTT
jgi:hypothetical protein